MSAWTTVWHAPARKKGVYANPDRAIGPYFSLHAMAARRQFRREIPLIEVADTIAVGSPATINLEF